MRMNITKLLVIQMLAFSGAIGCANAPPPRSMELAEMEIAAAKKDDLASIYPGLVKKAEASLAKSRTESREGDPESADLHAQIARAKVQSARSLVRRQEAQNQMKAMEKSVDDIQGVAEETENMSAVATRFQEMQSEFNEASREPERYTGIEREARRSLSEARKTQSVAIAVGAPELSQRSYDEGEMLVESSLRQLTIGGPEESLELSRTAIEAFKWAIRDARGASAAQDVEAEIARRDKTESRHQAAPKPVIGSAQTASAELRQLAQDHVLKVKMGRAEALGRGEDNHCPENFKEAGAVLDIASEELEGQRYANAFELAVRAEERLKRCDVNPQRGELRTSAAPAPQTQTSRPAQTGSMESSARVDSQVPTKSKAEIAAIEAITNVQIEVSKMRLKRPNDLRVTEATSLLTHAEEWLTREQFDRSLSLARAAQTVLDSPEAPPVKEVKAPVAPEKPKEAPVPTQVALGTEDTEASEASEASDEKVVAIEAIARARKTRAGADLTASPSTVQVADSLLKDARSKFASKRYPQATVLAEQARASYSALSNNTPQQGGDSNWQEAYKTVLDALVARDRAIQVNSQESNDTLEQGIEFLRKARTAWGSADYEASKRFAEASLKDFSEVHTLAKDSKEAAVQAKVRKLEARDRQASEEQAKEQESARKGAADALRQLEIEVTECASCADRAPEDFQKVEILLRDAKSEYTRGEFEEAQNLTTDAQRWVENINSKPWTVSLGPNLRAKDGAIEVEPKVDFKTGSTSVTPESRAGISALAKLMRENPRALEYLEIQGYTDSRGNDEKNLQLSQKRADDVLNQLKAAGVDSSNMSAIGYGETNPIESNDTAVGRAANRRVEFRVRLADGVLLQD